MKLRQRKKRQQEKAGSAGTTADFARQNMRHEIGGVLLIAAGILLGLALLSYHQSDPIGLLDEDNIYKVKNWLGVFGASISAPIFQWTLGYPILAVPLLIIISGLYLLLKLPLRNLYVPSLLLVTWSIFISVILAMPEAFRTFGHLNSFYPSGFLGGVIAAYLVILFSRFGALFILIIILLLLGIVTFRFRVSVVPRFLAGLAKSTFHGTRKLMTRLIVSTSQFFKRRKTAAASSRSGSSVPEGIPPDSDSPYRESPEEEPALPPTAPREPLEIVPRQKAALVEDSRFSDPRSEEALENPEGDTAVKIPRGDLGFEVEGAHQETELDYDSLIRDSLAKYQFPSTELLIEQDSGNYHLSEDELKNNAHLLEETLAQFGVSAVVNRVVEGPVITLYEVKPAQGVKINQIVSLADDLALAMRAKGIRMIAPIPGKAAIGIEIPNREPSTVYFKSIVRSETFINFDARLPIGMGKTISGEVYCADLTKMPHLLIAGATGSGKSVGINTLIASLLYRVPPSDLKFVMIDPKKLELSIYAKLRDHYLAVCPDIDEVVITHPQNAIMILRSVVNEMESRYDKLASLGVREITHYNRKIDDYKRNGETSDEFRKLPYLVVVIDELADLILSAMREVEEPITRLAQMARAVGIHLIMATQRPSVDILTGLIKANFPARIAYQVATRPDSKVILDMFGAEKLIGNGDLLFMPPGKVKPIRLQNPLISTDEVDLIIKHIRKQPKFPPYELRLIKLREKGPGTSKIFERDELFEKAKDTVIRYQQGSVSLLQRKLKIGYARAARIIDELEEAGIVGPPHQEGKARDVLISGYSPDPQNLGDDS